MNVSATVLLLGGALLAATPARAEFPFALRAKGGLGLGGTRREDIIAIGPFAMASADAVWRYAPGSAIVASYGTGGGPIGLSYAPESQHLNDASYTAVTLGLELSRPAGSGVAAYVQGGLGAGAATTSAVAGINPWSPGGPSPTTEYREKSEWGPAMSGEIGLRLVPEPGPMGFLLGIRGTGVVAPHSSSGGIVAFFGLTLHPH